MPELPEVETTRRGIATIMNGQTLKKFIVHESRMRWPIPPDLPELVTNQTILACERRGKYLLLRFTHGTQLIHLGMSGSLRRVAMDAERLKHDHAEWVFDDARFLLHDPRRFGAVLWHDAGDGPIIGHPLLAKLGIEPFDPLFTGAYLHAGLRGKSQAIKQALLAGGIVVGVGNIYASEALLRARINPRAATGGISMARCATLAQAIKDALHGELEIVGCMLREYVTATDKP